MLKMIVVVILNYNDGKNCLKVANHALENINIDKVIIVDNCSPDNSYLFLKEQESENLIILKSDRNGGFAYGHNVGIKYALENYNPEVLFTINSDVIVENAVLNKLIDFQKNNKEYGLISCSVREKNGEISPLSSWAFPSLKDICLSCSWIFRKFKRKSNSQKYVENGIMEVDAVRGSLMCFKGEALKDVDGFDEHTFLYYEENIMGKRLKKAGYRVGILPQIEYLHNHKENIGPRYVDIRPNLESAYYYATQYGNVQGIKKAILKICVIIGIVEQDLITKIKKKIIKRRKG